MDKAIEELFADVYGGIVRFGNEEFTETVKSITEERTGQKQANGERETRGPPEERYSYNEAEKLGFDALIEQFYNKTISRANPIFIGRPERPFAAMFGSEAPLIVTASDMTKSTRAKQSSASAHNISESFIRSLPENIKKAVFGYTETRNGVPSFTVICLDEGTNTLIAIGGELDTEYEGHPVNRCRSIFEISSPEFFLQKENKRLVTTNKKEAKNILEKARIQSPALQNILDSVATVPQTEGESQDNYSVDDEIEFSTEVVDAYSGQIDMVIYAKDKSGRLNHIYDLTQNIRDTARLVDGGRLSKSIALSNGVSDDIIRDTTTNSQDNYSVDDEEYLDAVERGGISVSRKVFDESVQKSDKVQRAIPYLDYIDDIVEKAVLLGTSSIGKPKSDNSVFMHSFYSIADIGDGPEVLKLYVEEMNDPNISGTTKRAYQLQYIERAELQVVGSRTNGSRVMQSAHAYTVSDLFALVKANDSSFKPKESSKAINLDGTPKVLYHQTENDFTVFDTRREGAGTRDDGTPFGIFLKSSDKDIGLRGKKQMDTLFAINAKKESAVPKAPGSTALPSPVTDSAISIAKLLEHVNRFFPDVLPENIFKRFGHSSRPKSEISRDIVFSVEDPVYDRELARKGISKARYMRGVSDLKRRLISDFGITEGRNSIREGKMPSYFSITPQSFMHLIRLSSLVLDILVRGSLNLPLHSPMCSIAVLTGIGFVSTKS